MSRIAKKPITIPSGVDVNISSDGLKVTVKGPKGQNEFCMHKSVALVKQDGNLLQVVSAKINNPEEAAGVDPSAVNVFAGTTRAIINNMVIGVSTGWERKLLLVGVGYRAQVQGKTLNLSLGYSHPVYFEIPEGIVVEMPIQTEIVIKGANKELVGQVAADIRSKRPVEPYKGKGIRYSDERVILKETKKK